MSFINDLCKMIDENVESNTWISCAQQDKISENTKFIIAAMEINIGLMCGGDGENCGEWTWFNNMDDLYDYLLHFAIPYNLCALEDHDPLVVMNGRTDEKIFTYDYGKENVEVKEDLFKLFQKLEKLRDKHAGYEAVKKELLKSNERCEKTDGPLIFRFYCFDNYKEAANKLLRFMSPQDEDFKRLKLIFTKDKLSQEDSEFLIKTFQQNGME